jgi:hypothetical protein
VHDRSSLSLEYGPGFARIVDQRATTKQRTITLSGAEAQIVLACRPGSTPEKIWRQIGPEHPDLDVEQITDYLDELVDARILLREENRYLLLAVPSRDDADEVEVERSARRQSGRLRVVA